MKEIINLSRRSIGAALLISLGCYVLLKIGNPYGPFLFALGLLGVCHMKLNLFTGKCGFMIANKISIKDILLILLFNLIGGYLFGLMFSIADTSLINIALDKVVTWDISWAFFIKSMLCGAVMYIAVYVYNNNKSNLGILLGVPLFIYAGFQHSIANVIYMGVARSFNIALLLCVLGNFVGSIITYYLTKEK